MIGRRYLYIALMFFSLASGAAITTRGVNKTPAVTGLPSTARASVNSLTAAIDAGRMQKHVEALASQIGVRVSGSPNDGRAADYIKRRFTEYGYQASIVAVKLPAGKNTSNVSISIPGGSKKTILVGAHFDSKYPSPGANDNASGVAVLLELARILRTCHPRHTLTLVAFGAEERVDKYKAHHHYGSKHFVALASVRADILCMTSLDMVGYGSLLHVDNQGQAADWWRDLVKKNAKELGLSVTSGRSKPWSDHAEFECYGIPTAYVHWEKDTQYHKATDRPQRIQTKRLTETTKLMLRAILAADAS